MAKQKQQRQLPAEEEDEDEEEELLAVGCTKDGVDILLNNNKSRFAKVENLMVFWKGGWMWPRRGKLPQLERLFLHQLGEQNNHNCIMPNLRLLNISCLGPLRIPVLVLTEFLRYKKDTLRALMLPTHIPDSKNNSSGGTLIGDFKDFVVFFRQLGECTQMDEFDVDFGHLRPKKRNKAWGESELERLAIQGLDRIDSIRKVSFAFLYHYHHHYHHHPQQQQTQLAWGQCEKALVKLCTDNPERTRTKLDLSIGGRPDWGWFLPLFLRPDSRIANLKCKTEFRHHGIVHEDDEMPLLTVNGVLQDLDLPFVQMPVEKGIEILQCAARQAQTLLSLALRLRFTRPAHRDNSGESDALAISIENLMAVTNLSLTFDDEDTLDDDDDDDDEVMDRSSTRSALETMRRIGNNRTLQEVTLDLPWLLGQWKLQRVAREINVCVATAAKGNPMLQRVRVFCGSDLSIQQEDDDDDDDAAVGTSQQHQRGRVSRKQFFEAETDFWLRLNNAGRYHLQSHPDDRERWVNAVIEQKEHTEVVYHLITTNPSLFV